MNPGFNLIDDPWILAQRHDGAVAALSLTELFGDATEYARLVGDLPTQALPILRLALAIMHQALDGPADEAAWAALWEAERLPAESISSYLDGYRPRFDLLHSTTPFYQVADLTTKKTEAGLSAFIADVPTGNPKYTTRAAEGLRRIGFGEAARWLVHCQAFDLSGIKGAADGDPRAKGGKSYPIGPGALGRLGAVYPEGDNVAQTLLLNLIPDAFLSRSGADIVAEDVPVWERDPHGPAPEERRPESVPKGLRDLYTWQSRRLRLVFDDEGVTGALICQGDRLELRDQFAVEPMTAWRRSENQERQLKSKQPVYLPRRHDPARNVWRGLAAALPALTGGPANGDKAIAPLVTRWIGEAYSSGLLERGRRVGYHVSGAAYGTQEAVITDLIDDRLTVAAAVFDTGHRELATAVAAAADDAEQAVKALAGFARDLARAAGGHDNVDGAGATAAESAYAALDTAYRAWLAGLDPDTDTDRARTGWQRTVRDTVLDIAARLAAAGGRAAWTGRKHGDYFLTSSTAQHTFRRKLSRALPLTVPDPSPSEEAAR
ncbi:MAG TPA: type I-E CRISPR-associated protein Cse1/CasA [Glycomyces sp.]|nr:type I-E CRISPR-associated protein Cse1/CasA [Glycomyces sp.]